MQLSAKARRDAYVTRLRAVAIVTLVVLVAAMAVIVWMAFTSNSAEPAEPVDTFVTYHEAWSSAMRKADVSATFPSGPVSLSHVRATGDHPFSATFTEREVVALLTVYRFESRIYGDRAALDRLDLDFPRANYASLTGRVSLAGDTYTAHASAPVTYDGERIVIWKDRTKLTVEGFSVGGRQREQAVSALTTYVNDLLHEAPGLEVDEATIVPGGVRVSGSAPDRIEHPAPVPRNLPEGVAVALR